MCISAKSSSFTLSKEIKKLAGEVLDRLNPRKQKGELGGMLVRLGNCVSHVPSTKERRLLTWETCVHMDVTWPRMRREHAHVFTHAPSKNSPQHGASNPRHTETFGGLGVGDGDGRQ